MDMTIDTAEGPLQPSRVLLPQDALPALEELCRRFHVRELILFGSANTDEFDATRSDIDFIVDFEKTPESMLTNHFGFQEAAEKLFGRSVHVMGKAPIRNPFLRRSIERNHRRLYPRP